jgi:hypothetical protein
MNRHENSRVNSSVFAHRVRAEYFGIPANSSFLRAAFGRWFTRHGIANAVETFPMTSLHDHNRSQVGTTCTTKASCVS